MTTLARLICRVVVVEAVALDLIWIGSAFLVMRDARRQREADAAVIATLTAERDEARAIADGRLNEWARNYVAFAAERDKLNADLARLVFRLTPSHPA